jgi:hypothetical protein
VFANGIIPKPTLRTYFSRKRILSTPGFGDVISRERFELIMKFLHSAMKALQNFTKYFLSYYNLNHKF